MKTCFVIIGYGEKLDPISNKTVNLDKTFNNIIKPAFEAKGYACNRSIDLNTSGIITEDMFKHILYSDFVVADLTTFNPNVMYELGVRHALKPYSTIIMCDGDSLTKIPFNVKDLVIHSYEHLGAGIDFEEVKKQQAHLKGLIEQLEQVKKIDSPIHTFIKDLKVSFDQLKEVGDGIGTLHDTEDSFATILEKAEAAKNDKDFVLAKAIYEKLHQANPSDEFITKRLGLVTYKAKSPNEETSLHNALKILNKLNHISKTDPETTGLMGAIYKRLYLITKEEQYLDSSILYYRKGYLINDDYYTGVNYAVMNDMKAQLIADNDEKKLIQFESRRARLNVVELVSKKLEETVDVEERGWQLLTKAEIEFDLGDDSLTKKILKNPVEYKLNKFQLDSFKTQYETKIKKE